MQKILPNLKRLEGSQIFTIAAGCFWGVEQIYRRHFPLIDARVGFANGNVEKYGVPSYRAVCNGNTGFSESLQVSYDPNQVSFRELSAFFFRMHDATQLNRQGPDVGTHYRSAIFVNNDEELKIAQEEMEIAGKKWYPHHTIVTKIEHLKNFYDAEEYHQEYLEKNPMGYECPTHFVRVKPKPA